MTEATPVNKFTRKVAREYKRLLYINSSFTQWDNEEMTISVDPYSAELANEYLVKELFAIDNIDEVTEKEYQRMKAKALEVKDEAFL